MCLYQNTYLLKEQFYSIIIILSSSQTSNFDSIAFYTKIQPILFERTQLLTVKEISGTTKKGLVAQHFIGILV